MERRWPDAILLAALLLFVAGLCLAPSAETDLFFRLKVGQEILARHALLRQNLFSFTHPEHPDIDAAWAFEVLLALVFRVAGFSGIVVVKTAIVGAAFAGAFAVARRRGASAVWTTVALAAAAFVMRDRFVERPHIVSFAGEVLLLRTLLLSERAGGTRWRQAGLFFVGVVAWANTHAGVFIAPLLCGVATAAAALTHRRSAVRLGARGAAALIACFVTPIGTDIVRYLALHLTLPRVHAIDEFRPATWRSDAPFFIYVGAGVIVAVVVAVMFADTARRRRPPGNRQISVVEWAPLVVAIGLGFSSVRFAADATFLAAPLFAVWLTQATARWVQQQGTPASVVAAAPPAGDEVRRRQRAGVIFVLASLLITTFTPRVRAVRAGQPFVSLGVDTTALPLEALRFVEANGLRDRMYNDFEIGSYLLFEGAPRHHVFVDPRVPAYPEEMHRLLGRMDHDAASWGAAMDAYRVDSALLAYAGLNRRVAWWNPADWALVYRRHDARVFVRRNMQRGDTGRRSVRDFIAEHEIPATFSFTVEEGARTLPLFQQPAGSPVSSCEWQRRLGDLLLDLDGNPQRARPHYERALATTSCLAPNHEATLSSWLGLADVAAGRLDLVVLARIDRALAIDPADAWARAGRARVLEALGRRSEARAEWARVAREKPNTELAARATARLRTFDSTP